ncbi:phosphoribosyltransferase [Oricola cellulosilytica]|uniref:Phosphoribosyltransferase n=1 Tax=Oricola cellulosilytica TaxID=1429082 RepID=A0A4R0P4T5_9HYPH|nr:phosphoribosyltransferase family protein [Oricola cellulosilytica]TCD11882.1 phosphoribosyltransferase [Oricola cellulosilytica]
MMIFEDRADAGRQLAEKLAKLELQDPVIVALPRGGVPVAAVIARALHADLDVMMVRKVGAPGQPELAVGAISRRKRTHISVNDDIVEELGLSHEDVARLASRQESLLDRRQKLYFGDREPTAFANRNVVIVDDGVATGATLSAALEMTRWEHPTRVVVAVPVGPADTIRRLNKEADQVVCLAEPEPFLSVGTYYRDFSQVGDEEVLAALSAFSNNSKGDHARGG